ncbi:MAG: hypothetical protein GEU98_06540 [Pseudonocardiaceae bacterium]|nr:hypothetical protein [Pseudonocardiaceae bacterium]
MFRVVVGICAAALVLAGCSSDVGDTVERSESSEQPSSVLQKLTENKMCDLLDDDAIEKALDTKVEGGKGMRRGKLPMFLTYECRYDTDGFPSISTDLTTTRASESDQEVLDNVFTDHSKESEPVGEYRKVTGLGTLAGFGPQVLVSEAVNSWELGVVSSVDGDRLLLTISVLGSAKLEQVKPLAEKLLANLESTVR